jgi:hypothetical protein
MKEIPPAKDIDSKSPIEIQTGTGIIRMFPLRVRRGDGRKRWCASIEGVCHTQVELMKQCFVLFKGREIGGNFSSVAVADYLWHVTYEMIIAVPEFWGEATDASAVAASSQA